VRTLGIVLGIAADWLIFTWAITRLPRIAIRPRGVARAALLGAVAFEVLKQVMAVYLDAVTGSPSGAVFGSLLGLLLFGYLVARLVCSRRRGPPPRRGTRPPPPWPPRGLR
jgi:membrane protein